MPYHLSERRAHIQEVLGEFKAARLSVSRLKMQVDADASTIAGEPGGEHLARAAMNLEGTYIVRMFAAFEAVLRSYDRYIHDDQEREPKAAVMIDQLGSKKRLKIRPKILRGVHQVRQVRNFWAHDTDDDPGPMPIDQARGFLQSYLNAFPDHWE